MAVPQDIPSRDASRLPSQYSSTPGGTLYSTTPGGTKIIYDKSVLMDLRNSPISKTPPQCDIPEYLLKGNNKNRRNSGSKGAQKKLTRGGANGDDGELFTIDI